MERKSPAYSPEPACKCRSVNLKVANICQKTPKFICQIVEISGNSQHLLSIPARREIMVGIIVYFVQ
jgi:hypothetical protein